MMTMALLAGALLTGAVGAGDVTFVEETAGVRTYAYELRPSKPMMNGNLPRRTASSPAP